MDNNKLFKELSIIFSELFNVENFNEKISMADIENWDSLKHVQLIVKIEQLFDIQIPFENTLEMTTVKSIIKVINENIS